MHTEDTSKTAGAPEKQSASNSLRPLLITVFTAKVAVSALLLATASFAPPVSANGAYMTASH